MKPHSIPVQLQMASDNTPATPLDLANWMRDLPPRVLVMPLINVAIPGSHNAMMYTVMKNSPTAADAPRGLDVMFRIFPKCVRNWLLTQSYGIRQQLEHGIRYLDIRTSYRDGQFMFCHGLFSCDFLQPLDEINTFLNGHPKEVVILDFQHVYNCNRELHETYCSTIISIFGKKVLPRIDTDLNSCSIKSMTKAGHQVIVVYRTYCDDKMQFWCSNNFPTPWPNTMSGRKLKGILEDNIQLRDKENGYVTQCVLTPTIKYILLHPFGSVKESCARTVLLKLISWIEECAAGPPAEVPTFNVFLADFVDLDEDAFTKTVIKLNLQTEEDEEIPGDLLNVIES